VLAGSFNSEGFMTTHPCESCAIRAQAEANPKTFKARLWKWHTTWCPGWKAYQKSLQEKGNSR
jgi:hypothetical protein